MFIARRRPPIACAPLGARRCRQLHRTPSGAQMINKLADYKHLTPPERRHKGFAQTFEIDRATATSLYLFAFSLPTALVQPNTSHLTFSIFDKR
jgi:hypothetical protein